MLSNEHETYDCRCRAAHQLKYCPAFNKKYADVAKSHFANIWILETKIKQLYVQSKMNTQNFQYLLSLSLFLLHVFFAYAL